MQNKLSHHVLLIRMSEFIIIADKTKPTKKVYVPYFALCP